MKIRLLQLSYEHPLFTIEGIEAQKRKRIMLTTPIIAVHIGEMVFMRMVSLVHLMCAVSLGKVYDRGKIILFTQEQ